MANAQSWLWGRSRAALSSVGAVVIALLVGAVVMAVTGSNPITAYRALWEGAFVGSRAIGETLIYSAPLILGGLAFAIAARAGLFNIGIEGQLVIGGFVAALVGAWDFGLPPIIYAPLAMIAGAAAGAIWGALPGIFRAKSGAHEVITTIMLNYLAFRLVNYLTLKRDDILPVDPTMVATKRVVDAARLPKVMAGSRLHVGIFVAVIAAILLWFVLYHTRFGYNVRAVGLSRGASAYGSINWGTTIIWTMTLSGVLAGLAGAGESLGLHGRAFTTPPGYGFTAIAVGLVGRNHPIGVIWAGLLFGALGAGAPSMQSADVSKQIVAVIQGLIILAIAALDVSHRISWLRSRAVAPTRPTDDTTPQEQST